MFSLPDFTKFVEFNEIFLKMGISNVKLHPISPDSFVRKVSRTILKEIPKEEYLNFCEQLSKTVDLTKDYKISHNKAGLLEINGQSCCIYIKDQRQYLGYGPSNYKYHIFECRTIQSMIASGRKDRYVATSRHDGYFLVNHQTQYSHRESLEKLDLCRNCYDILRSRNLVKDFDLSTFFDKYKNNFSRTYQREETVIATEQYSPNINEIATKYKEQARYICQICGLDCSQYKYLIHLHHINGDGNDNTYTNVRVLCCYCHSRCPLHEHMKYRFANQIDECKRLWKIQGIYSSN